MVVGDNFRFEFGGWLDLISFWWWKFFFVFDVFDVVNLFLGFGIILEIVVFDYLECGVWDIRLEVVIFC